MALRAPLIIVVLLLFFCYAHVAESIVVICCWSANVWKNFFSCHGEIKITTIANKCEPVLPN